MKKKSNKNFITPVSRDDIVLTNYRLPGSIEISINDPILFLIPPSDRKSVKWFVTFRKE